MSRYLNLLALPLILAITAGCETMGDKQAAEEAAVEERGAGAAAEGAPGAETRAVALAGKFDARALQDPDSPLSKRVIYFDFDSNEVRPEYRPILAAHAEFLARNSQVTVVLEGHADERGSREYNIALGERRTKAVKQLLVLQGASASQMQSISFGEERPVALGHEDSAWSLNRRVELLYSGY